MQKQEPVIIVNEFTNDQLPASIEGKIAVIRTLNNLQKENSSLEQRLLQIEDGIKVTGLQSRIEVFQQTQDSIPPQ